MTGRAGFRAGLERPGEQVTGASEPKRGRPARTGPPALPASHPCPLHHEGLVPDQTWPRSCTPRPSTGSRAHRSQRPEFPQGAGATWTARMCHWASSGSPQGRRLGQGGAGWGRCWRPACIGSWVWRCRWRERPGQAQALDPGEAAHSRLTGAQGYSIATWAPTWAGHLLLDLTQFGPSAPPTERPLRC